MVVATLSAGDTRAAMFGDGMLLFDATLSLGDVVLARSPFVQLGPLLATFRDGMLLFDATLSLGDVVLARSPFVQLGP